MNFEIFCDYFTRTVCLTSVQVRVTNALDKAFSKMTVTVDSILDKNDDELASKKTFSEQKD